MDYSLISDEELVEMSATGDKKAEEFLLNKYKNLVKSRVKSYYIAGGDREDLVQEGMIGLFKAIRDYNSEKQVGFHIFADMCIKRQIITAIKTSLRQKHFPLNNYVSLNKPAYDDESERTLVETLIERDSIDPEELYLKREKIKALGDEIEKKLSDMEKTVLSLYLEGLSYKEIAEVIGKTPKSIDNALQRIKRKLDKHIDI